MKRLIVNADDFGYTRGVNSGIIRGFRDGIVTSTTIMANGAAFEDAVERAKENPTLAVGCHLVLVGGVPVEAASAIPSLADREGRLPPTLSALTGKLLFGAVRGEDLARELRAQLNKIVKAGIQPTHLDSHKHAHANPRVMEQMARVAEEFGIRRMRRPFEDIGTLLKSAFQNGWGSLKRGAMALVARTGAPRFEALAKARCIRTPDHLCGVVATGNLGRTTVLSIIESLPEGASELVCHPGEYDQDLERSATRLKRERQQELEALTNPVVRAAIDERGIELSDFRGLD